MLRLLEYLGLPEKMSNIRNVALFLCIGLCSALKVNIGEDPTSNNGEAFASLQEDEKCPTTVPIHGKRDANTGITSYTFKYAVAPRWEEGTLVEIPSEGEPLDASKEGEKCLQGYCAACGWKIEGDVSFSEIQNGAMGSEDCLFLSLFVSDKEKATGKPMPMVFHIHHGQGIFGFKAELGEVKHVVEKGIVAVTANMRMGGLGTFAHPEVEQPNLQISDVINALRWVQKYACIVGGDPNRVTISGSSSGGAMASALIASPRATGLFSGAWINSPVGLGYNGFHTKSKEVFHEKHVKPCMKAAGCDSLACMKAIPGKELVSKFITDRECSLSRYSPKVMQEGADAPGAPFDGEIIPFMQDAACKGTLANANVPVVIGTSLNEMDTLKWQLGTHMEEKIKEVFGKEMDRANIQEDAKTCMTQKLLVQQDQQSTMEDSQFQLGPYLWATKNSPQTGPRWHFTITAPASKSGRSWHTQAELMVWNATLKDSSTMYASLAKQFIFENASPDLREYIAENFQHFIQTGKVKDPNWEQTSSVADDQLGGLPSNDLNNHPASTMTRQYHHSHAAIKAMHSIICNKKVPEPEQDKLNLKSCVADPVKDGGVSMYQRAKYWQDNMWSELVNLKSTFTFVTGMLSAR